MDTHATYGRPRDERELTAWMGIIHRSFGVPLAEFPAWLAQLGEENARVLRDAPRAHTPVAALALLDMGQWFGGRSVPTGGVVAVGVEPYARGAGQGGALMRAALVELAERRCALSTLFPATNTFYGAFGYGLAGARHDVTLRLRELALDRTRSAEAASTWLRPFTADDAPELRRIYAARARTTSGWMDRHRYLWARVQNWLGEQRAGYVVGHGEAIEGYVFVVQRRSAGALEQELGVSDAFALTRRAGARILALFGDYATLCPRARCNLAPDDPLLGLLSETCFEARFQMPWMVRVVDVERALASRGYATALRGELAFELTDELFPANGGRWTLTVEGGASRVTRGGDGSLALDVRALASLYSGWQSASVLAQTGACRGNAGTLALADALFAGPAPSMPDMF